MKKITCPECESNFRAQINSRNVYCPFCGIKFKNKIEIREASTEALLKELESRGVALKVFD